MKRFYSLKHLMTISLGLFLASVSFGQTATKTYNPGSSTSVDGCGSYCNVMPSVTFTQADFTQGCQVTDVNVNIVWAKTDGTCTAPGTGNSFHAETNFRIDGPTSNEVLVQPGTYTGTATISAVSTTFDQAAGSVVGGATPISGTFRPNNGNLNNFNGTNGLGNWELRPGDTGGGDPLCVTSYSVTITTAPDVTAPSFTVCVPDQNENLDGSCQFTIPDYTGLVTVNELCGFTLSQSPIAGTVISSPTVTAITITATDSYGNSSDCNFNLTTVDANAPVPDLGSLADVNAECSATPTAPTSTDNCVGAVIGTPDVTFPVTAQGTTMVTWTYDDGNGNTTTQTQNVVLADVTNPVPDAGSLADIVECTSSTPATPTATDNCVGSIAGTPDATFPITTPGLTVVTWTFDDGNGNTSTQTQNVTIGDFTNPVPDAGSLSDITECTSSTPTAPTATDNCAGSLTGTPDVTFPITTPGLTVVTWTYDDGSGNTVTQTQNVTIGDAVAPVPDVSTLPDINEECSSTPTAPTATDNCAGSLTATPDVTFPITTQGTTIITWSYDDGNGNTVSQIQTVNIADVSAPVPDVGTLADVTECFEATPTAPTATDNCAGALTGTPDVTFPITASGTTVVTWTYDDGNGNVITQTQNVIVDTVNANATLTGATITADNSTATSYQWLDCDNGYAVISGETTDSYTPPVTGNYAVEVTDNGCVDTSACILVDYTSIDPNVSDITINIYPNPSTGIFNVELNGLNGDNFELRIVDVQGRIIVSENFNGSSVIKAIDISESENGIYIIQLVGDQGILLTRQIVKQ